MGACCLVPCIPMNKHHLIIKEHLIDTWTQIRKNTMCNNMHRTCEFVDHQILQHVDCIEHSLYYSPNYHPHNLIRLWLSCKGCQPTWHAYILWWCCLWNRIHVKHSPDEVMPSSYDSHHCKRDAAALQLGHCSSREAFSWWGHAIIIWLTPLQARCRCIATRAPQWPP